MNYKKIVKIGLLGFVIASLGYLVFSYAENNANDQTPRAQTGEQASTPSESGPAQETASNPNPNSNCAVNDPECQNQDQPARQVIAYYFHGTYRCITCRTIEQYSKEAIETGFGKELQAGKLKFMAVNVEEPDNRHFIQDYQLITKSLVLVDLQNGQQRSWKNLEQVWTYVRNKPAFIKYVQDEIKGLLERR